jgi:hypothetical protein
MNEVVQESKEAPKSNAGQGLGIAGFVLGLTALIIAWIPCLGMWALLPGIIAIVLSVIALVQANKGGGTKGLIIAALVVSILGSIIAGVQLYLITSAVDEGFGQFEEGMQDWADEMEEATNEGGIFDDLENSLQDLEDGLEGVAEEMNAEFADENWDKLIEEGDFDVVIDEYEEMIQEYIIFVEKAEAGDLSALGSYMKLASKLTIVSMKLATIMPKLTPEQLERFNEIDEKYQDNLQ